MTVEGGWRCSCVPSVRVISVSRLLQEERPVMNLVTSKPLRENFRRFVGLRHGLFKVTVQA